MRAEEELFLLMNYSLLLNSIALCAATLNAGRVGAEQPQQYSAVANTCTHASTCAQVCCRWRYAASKQLA